MKADFLDRWSRLDSPLHRAPAGIKLALAISVLLVCALSPSGWMLGCMAVLLVAAARSSRIPAGFLLRRMLFLEPFAIGVAFLSLFQPGGSRVFLFLVARATLCLFAITLLTNTTPFAAILGVLRRLRFPPLLITTLALLYRYLFVLIDEIERMQRAAACRSFQVGRLRQWRLLASLAGQLFVRSTERAERIYAAMCARGWKS